MGLAQINIRFAANLREFSTQMQTIQRDFAKVGSQMQSIGTTMSLAITAPLVGLGAASMKAAADLEQLKTSLNTVFKGNTDLSTKAFETIQKFATETPYGLEEVTQSFIKLKNLGLDASEDSLRSYGNTASAMSKSLDQMIEAVADASVGEFERLKEFGIKSKSEGDQVSFTFQGVTTTVGKNAAEITKYLKDIGNVNFAGGMEAQSKTFNGQMAKLKDALQITMAEFGQIMNDVAGPVVAKIAEWIEGFQSLDPAVKKIIVVVAGLLAVAGPLIAAFGAFAAVLPSIISGIGSMGVAFTALSGPIGWVIAAVGLIIGLMVNNWGSVKKSLVDTANYFIDLYNESVVFRGSVELIIYTFKGLWQIAKLVFNVISSLLKALFNDIKNVVTEVGSLVKAILTGDFSSIPDIFKRTMGATVGNVASALKDLSSDFSQFSFDMNKAANDAIGNTTTKRHKLVVDTSESKEKIKTDVETAIIEGVTEGVDKSNKKIKIEVQPIKGSVGYYDKLISELESAQKNTSTDDSIFKVFQNKIDQYKKLRDTITGELKTDIAVNSAEWFNTEIATMEQLLVKLDMSSDAYKDLANQIAIYKKTLEIQQNPVAVTTEPAQDTVDWYTYQINQLKEQRAQAGITLDEYKRLSSEINILETTFKLQVDATDVEETTSELKELAESVRDSVQSAFGSMTDSMVDSLGEAQNGLQRFAQGMFKTVMKLIAMALSSSIANAIQGATQSATATGPGALFTTPAFISTAVGGVMAAFASIPKFANGGIVSGPTLGLMGEYAGAANNPEVIAPLNKLKELIAPATNDQPVNVILQGGFDVSGEQLKLVLDRFERRKFRTG